jgi:predicted nucleic acid-binding protein
MAGDEFYISVITHFQVLWGYHFAGLSSEKYERLLEVGEIEVSPLTRLDVEAAAEMKPKRSDLLDALIAASVKRHDASIWTRDRDFLNLLPQTRVKLIWPPSHAASHAASHGHTSWAAGNSCSER